MPRRVDTDTKNIHAMQALVVIDKTRDEDFVLRPQSVGQLTAGIARPEYKTLPRQQLFP